MQNVLIAGDTLDFRTTVPDYPASDGWTLTYKLIPRTSGSVISFNAGVDGDEYRAQVSALTTAAWAPGEYSWAAYATLGGDRFTVETGTIKVLPDPGAATSWDNRTHAQKTLDAINAVIENRATKDQSEYSIAGRSLKLTPVDDLLRLRDLYEQKVAREQLRAQGINPRAVYVRFRHA